MTLERRTQSLLDLVENDRRTRSDALLADARARASTLVAQAHADARARMREAWAEERQRARDRVAAAAANLQTRRRLHEQKHGAALLALAWQRLPDALRQRWRDADSRSRWTDAVVTDALRLLPRGQWRIIRAPDWPEGEREAVAARLARDPAVRPEFAADTDIDAGMRIVAGGNVVDGTLAGMVADRDDIGAKLLRQLEVSG
jgi:vacuolar-type H+-ATPase subunit H